jgi:hypothetical protein
LCLQEWKIGVNAMSIPSNIRVKALSLVFVWLFQFGKGIYFADMSSKSANYCFASRLKNTGLLLLSEVRQEHICDC